MSSGGISGIAAAVLVTGLLTTGLIYKVRTAKKAIEQAKKVAEKATQSPLQVVSTNALTDTSYSAAANTNTQHTSSDPSSTVLVNPITKVARMTSIQPSVRGEKVRMGFQPVRPIMESIRAGTGDGLTNTKQAFANLTALEGYNRKADMKSFQATQARTTRRGHGGST